MVDLKIAKSIFIKLQELDSELCNLILSDDGETKITGKGEHTLNINRNHHKYISICRDSLKAGQSCINEIINDLKDKD